MPRLFSFALVLLSGASACRAPDRPMAPVTGAEVVVDSDPRGARITLDGAGTGKVTPDTLRGLILGPHELLVQLDSAGLPYSYAAQFEVDRNERVEISAPVILRCSTSACANALARYHTPNSLRFAVNPAGTLFFLEGRGRGILWPATTENSYAAYAGPVFAGILSGRDTVALGVYNSSYFAGRPAPTISTEGGRFSLRQLTWILPPSSSIPLRTVRGVAVSEELIARAESDDVVVVRLVFRNISAQPIYRAMDPLTPAGGWTYESAYIGFALDADVGASEDDLVSYVPELNLAFTYDSNFSEPTFSGAHAGAPALVGIRVLDAPASGGVVMQAWPRETAQATWDWLAGNIREKEGWAWLSGTANFLGNHPHPGIGYAPTSANDYRMSLSSGPLRLAAGDSAVFTVAVVLAPPAAGTYTSGTVVPPGDPTDAGRPILRVAAPLIERARAAGAVLQ